MWPIVLRMLILVTMTFYMFIYSYYYKNKINGLPSASPKRMESLDNNYSHWSPELHAVLTNLSQLNCSLLAQLNISESVKRQLRQSPITLDADPANDTDLSMDCSAVLGRWDFHQRKMALSQAEIDFPIAFARTVFKDYLLIEQLLSVEYTPNNLYCYALDSKATALFKRRIRTLASCLSDNVFVSDQEFNVRSNGQNVSSAHLACLEELWRRSGDLRWKYVFLLQNHDIPLRTNAELVQILKLYGGANEIGTTQITPGSIDSQLNWTYSDLHLYRNGSSTDQRLNHTKSTNLVAITYPAVEFLLQNLSLDTFIKRLELSWYGMDEVFLSTLNSNLVDFPGGFTRRCLDKFGKGVRGLGRMVIWADKPYLYEVDGLSDSRCPTRYRHGVCIFGLEHLGLLNTNQQHHFYANKMMPEYDYGCIHCWLRILSFRGRGSNASTIVRLDDGHSSHFSSSGAETGVNVTFFWNWPHIRYNRLKAAGKLDEFHC